MLAGVGLSWYTWIEQGRAKNVSAEILESIASALRLDDTQRTYMLELAGKPAPQPPAPPVPDRLPAADAVVEHWLPNPAYTLDRSWNVHSANTPARELLGIIPGVSNYLETFFGSTGRLRAPDRQRQAAATVARFRAQAASAAADDEVAALIERMRAESAEFRELWDDYIVKEDSCTTETHHHERAGTMTFTRVTLAFTCRSGLTLNLLMPTPGTSTAALQTERRSMRPPVSRLLRPAAAEGTQL